MVNPNYKVNMLNLRTQIDYGLCPHIYLGKVLYFIIQLIHCASPEEIQEDLNIKKLLIN